MYHRSENSSLLTTLTSNIYICESGIVTQGLAGVEYGEQCYCGNGFTSGVGQCLTPSLDCWHTHECGCAMI